jgi:hypothetical protein
MSYTFDGPNKRINIDSIDSFSVTDLYSRWKDWVVAGNAQYIDAFRSVAGDPIGVGQSISPYIFLNTVDGWRIKPFAADHELLITGNLYSEDSSLPMFVAADGYTVNVIIERSSSSITTLVGRFLR